MSAQTAADYQRVVNAAYEKYKNLNEGKNADYIPALAKVNPDLFGIALVTPDGKVYTAGDVTSEVSIQSVSKVFTMARVFQQSGEKAVEDNIGVDATGQAFNSIVAIEQYKGKEMNPLVNPGAITTTSMIDGWQRRRGLDDDHQHARRLRRPPAQRQRGSLQVGGGDESAQSGDRAADVRLRPHQVESAAGDRSVHAAVFSKCERADLATMAATLANGGRNPVTSKQVIEFKHVAPTLAVMATAGLYDDSGKWLFATGLPAKSGVGGGSDRRLAWQVRHRRRLAAARRRRQQRSRPASDRRTSPRRSAATR